MRSMLLTSMIGLVACATGQSLEENSADASVRRGGYELEVVDDSGIRMPTYWQSGRAYVLGALDQHYQVRVHNRSGRRIEAVITVDGRNVVDGRTGDFRSQRGYLVDPYSSTTIDGFRTSLDSVAAFRFGTVAESYASRMGDARSVGVIGVAVFPERAPIAYRPQPPYYRPPYPYPYPRPRRDPGYGPYGGLEGDDSASAHKGKSGSPAPSAEASPADKATRGGASDGYAQRERKSSRDEERPGLGTVYGEARTSYVDEVPFQRAHPTTPDAVLTIRYNDREGLLALGVRLDPPRRPYRPYDDLSLRENARPFPNTPTSFAPPPPYTY